MPITPKPLSHYYPNRVPPEAWGDAEPGATAHDNLDAVADLFATEYYTWRGIVYEIPPVPVPLGARLLKLEIRLATLPPVLTRAEEVDEEAAIMAEVRALLPQAMRPTGWRGWFWRWRREPFREMSLRDVTKALFHCCAARGACQFHSVRARREVHRER